MELTTTYRGFPLSSLQESGRGIGLQLESILSYLFTEQFSVGTWCTLLGHVDHEGCNHGICRRALSLSDAAR